jgi:hypothetical protein
MTDQARRYLEAGDRLKGRAAEQAYRAAQGALLIHDADFLSDYKRIQRKIIRCIEGVLTCE